MMATGNYEIAVYPDTAQIGYAYRGRRSTSDRFWLLTANSAISRGRETCCLSDFGQAGNPTHADGLLAFIRALRDAGLTESEIDLMARRNPARLLGLE